MPPFFSVVIPTFNRAELLREAVQSVLDQTFGDFELIVVDDHSTDDTAQVIRSFSDPRLSFLSNYRGRGGAGTRNAGIFRARGEWVAFLDDDDTWHPHKLSILHKKILEAGGSSGLIYTGYAQYDYKKRVETDSRLPEKEGWLQRELLYKNYIGTFSVVAIRTDLLLVAGGLDEEFLAMQDMELYARIARITKIAAIKENLSRIRLGNKDRITVSPEKKLQSSLLFWKKNSRYINRDMRLMHRAASRVFLFAMQKADIVNIMKALPLMLTGLFVDYRNFYSISREILSFYYRKVRA